MKNIALVLACLALASCRTNPPQSQPISFSTESFSSPEIGAIITSDIGEQLLTQETGMTTGAITIPSDQKIGDFLVKKGKYSIAGQNKEYTKFSRVTLHNTKTKTDRPGDLFLFTKDAGTKNACISRKICSDIDYSIDKITRTNPDYRQDTLIYIGKFENKITLGYREFVGDIARPAFSNDVTYDLSESKILGYKRARLEVIEATNTGIKYKVLANFK